MRHSLGIRVSAPGQDVTTCISSNHLLLPAIFLAAIRTRGIYSAASPALTVSELTRQIQDSGIRLVIASEDVRATATDAARVCGIPPERVLTIPPMSSQRALTSLADPSHNYLDESREHP